MILARDMDTFTDMRSKAKVKARLCESRFLANSKFGNPDSRFYEIEQELPQLLFDFWGIRITK